MQAFTVQGSYMGGVFVGCLFWGWARCSQNSIQFDFFQFNQFGHQLGALKSQFDFIQFNQFIFISTPARGSQNSIQFNSTNMF